MRIGGWIWAEWMCVTVRQQVGIEAEIPRNGALPSISHTAVSFHLCVRACAHVARWPWGAFGRWLPGPLWCCRWWCCELIQRRASHPKTSPLLTRISLPRSLFFFVFPVFVPAHLAHLWLSLPPTPHLLCVTMLIAYLPQSLQHWQHWSVQTHCLCLVCMWGRHKLVCVCVDIQSSRCSDHSVSIVNNNGSFQLLHVVFTQHLCGCAGVQERNISAASPLWYQTVYMPSHHPTNPPTHSHTHCSMIPLMGAHGNNYSRNVLPGLSLADCESILYACVGLWRVLRRVWI